MNATEFYVGYLPRAPAALARATRRRVLCALASLALLGLLLARAHALRPGARFEFGAPRELTGTLRESPVPHLVVPRPGAGSASASRYLLVAPYKHGAGALVAGYDGRAVRLRATLAWRDGRVVAEVVPGSIRALEEAAPAAAAPEALGRRTLAGEIVDAKCFFGVMNPGERKPHRGCAVRCISGGIPPVLCVRDGDGRASTLVLVPADLPELLAHVAEPVEVTGELERHGEILVLRCGPGAYRRLE
jgi:hypothetical protein